MKIVELEIKNFRSIACVKLQDLGSYLSISGRNNAGKTNLVSALFSAISAVDEDEFEFFSGQIRRSRASIKGNLPVWLRSETSQGDKTIHIRLLLEIDPTVDKGVLRFLETMGGDQQLRLDEAAVKLHVIMTAEPPDYKRVVSVSVGDVMLDAYRAGEVLRKIRSMEPFYYHNSVEMNHRYVVGETFRELVGESIQGRIGDLGEDWKAMTAKLSPVLEDARSELSSLLGRLEDRFSLSLSIHEQLSPAMLPLTVSLEDNTKPVPMEQWGSGTRNRTLILARLLNTVRRAKDEDDLQPILIVEEPESFLHPSAQADFGRVLQAISRDLGVQIIVTTHSPYLLSHQHPEANILLERRSDAGINHTCVVENQSEWIRPFELALGISSPELYGLKGVFFGEKDKVIFAEGPTDVKYLEFFKDELHGDRRLMFDGTIYPYGGASKIQNQTLLKFMRERFGTLIVTVDLDLVGQVRNDLTKAGFEEGKDFLPVGEDSPGKRAIEGLVPNSVLSAAMADDPSLILAIQEKGDKEAASLARSKWKQKVLEKFLSTATPGSAELEPFYRLIKKLNAALGASTGIPKVAS